MTQSIWFLGARFNIIADATNTGGKYDLVEGYFPSGSQTPPHRHTRYSERFGRVKTSMCYIRAKAS
jgi:hypothetical protein